MTLNCTAQLHISYAVTQLLISAANTGKQLSEYKAQGFPE